MSDKWHKGTFKHLIDCQIIICFKELILFENEIQSMCKRQVAARLDRRSFKSEKLLSNLKELFLY